MKYNLRALTLSILLHALFVWAMIESFHMPVIPTTFADDHWETYQQLDIVVPCDTDTDCMDKNGGDGGPGHE